MIPEGFETDSVAQLETNLDDVIPEIVGHATGMLLNAGALDVWVVPIQMKKQRPGMLLTVLCQPNEVEKFAEIILTQTSAFGLRITQATRLKLQRDFVEVATEFGDVMVKRGFRGDTLLQVSPEYESCRAAAERTGQPLQRVYEAALNAGRLASNAKGKLI